MNKTLYYIGNFNFKDESAATKLVYNNSVLLRSIGYHVVLVGNYNPKQKTSKFKYSIYKEFESIKIPFQKNFNQLFLDIKLSSELANLINQNSTNSSSYVIFYGSPSFSSFLYLIKSKLTNCVIFGNHVDMSSVNHGNIILWPIKIIDRFLIVNFYLKYTRGMICVSSYIDKFYKRNKFTNTIILPPLSESIDTNIDINLKQEKNIKFFYAGTPFPTDGRFVSKSAYKDRLDSIIEFVHNLYDTYKMKVELNIFGITKNQYLKVVKHHEKILKMNYGIINFFGLKKREDVEDVLRKSHFSVLIRNSNKMTNSGFSTKLVESISNGIPVISNLTSDINKYLIEDKNALFISHDPAKSAEIFVAKIFNLNYSKMKKYCKQNNPFSPSLHKQKIKSFLYNEF